MSATQADIPQAKMLRLFGVIEDLCIRPRHVNYLTDRYDMSVRTVHRYIFLLNEIGFKITNKRSGFYELDRSVMPDFVKYFTPE